MKEKYFNFKITPTWLAHSFKAITKQHHNELRPVFEKFISSNAVVLDVGAHAGQFTKLFSKIAKNGMVISVEPGSYARSILRIAVYLSKLRNVVIVPAALGSVTGVEILHLPQKRKGSFGFGLSHISGLANDISERLDVVADIVPSVQLDELAEKMNLERLDFIKADIEGWELRMITGGLQTIKRFRPVIYLEMIDNCLQRAGDSMSSAWQTLSELGYKPHVLDPHTMGLIPLESIQEGDIWWLDDK
ncbi:MAG: FkbM family methyltransferase [Rhodospirillaceae bacterium]|nr:FkbM family methyltransferase [Rhodospirillaceae bacterium]